MKVLNHVDLGRAFETLKNDFLRVEKEKEENLRDNDKKENVYAAAYGRLSAAVEYHICWHTDTNFGDIHKEAENPLETNDNSGAMAD